MEKFFYRLRREKALVVLFLMAALAVAIQEWGRPEFRSPRHAPPAASVKKPASYIPKYFVRWRENFLDANRPPQGKDELGLVRGIFLGDDSAVTEPVRDRFREAGLTHLLAASGFNCWIVAMLFCLVGRLSLHYGAHALPSMTYLSLKRHITPAAKIFGAWLFWLWTDQSPPITRSALLISTRFGLELFGLRVAFGRLLFVQYLLALTIWPRMWHNASFQLTFGCLFGLVLVPPWLERFRPSTYPPVDKVWDYLAEGLGACLGTIPTTFIVFGEMNFTSICTNWFAVPPVSFALMPLGLAQMLLLAPDAPWERLQFVHSLVAFLAGIEAGIAATLNFTLEHWFQIFPSLRF